MCNVNVIPDVYFTNIIIICTLVLCGNVPSTFSAFTIRVCNFYRNNTLGSCNRYKAGGRGSQYWYILGLSISTKKWPGHGPHYLYSVRITRYVWVYFVSIVNPTRESRYPYCTDNETLVY